MLCRDIDKLGTAGVTKGCNPPVNDMFCPDTRVTRGQMAAFLVRALGYDDDSGGNLFVDDDDSIFETDIDKLATAASRGAATRRFGAARQVGVSSHPITVIVDGDFREQGPQHP